MAAQLLKTFETRNKTKMVNPVMSYIELLAMPQWDVKRELILVRDGHQCRNCGGKERLQVHHRQYHINKYGEKVRPWNYANRYLITLCNNCHRKGHEQYKVPFFKLS